MRIGDYVVEQALEANVFVASHVMLPRTARLTIASPSQAVAVLREACVLEALQHPGVPRVFECGMLSDRRPWLATELVDGEALGRLNVTGVIALLRDVAEILDHAHRRGVVHGGICTEAIVKASPRRGFPVCLLGWGSAHVSDDKAGDVRALGAVAYLALIGSPAGVPAARRAPGAPPRLTSLIDRMLDGALTAAAVHGEAAKLAEMCEVPPAIDDGPIEQVDVVLVEIAPEPVKMRWTPPLGSPTHFAGTPIASIAKRGAR